MRSCVMRCYQNDSRRALEEMSTLEYLIKKYQNNGDIELVKALESALHKCWEYHFNILGEEIFYTFKYYSNPIREEKIKEYWRNLAEIG